MKKASQRQKGEHSMTILIRLTHDDLLDLNLTSKMQS